MEDSKSMHSRQLEKCFWQAVARYRTLFFALVCGFVFVGVALGAQQAGGVQAAGPKVRMVRSLAGTNGENRTGWYVFLFPRSPFSLPDLPHLIFNFHFI